MYTMKCYSALKRNKVLIHAATWMNRVNVMLSERNQMQRATYFMIPFTRNVQKRQIHREEKQISGCLRLESEIFFVCFYCKLAGGG